MIDPYNPKKVYGPYTRSDGRKHVVLVFNDNTKKTVSYPKYLIECSMGRILDLDETVDHIDGDFTNDSISNLRVLERSEHIKNDVLRNRSQQIVCPVCQNIFELSGKKLSQAIQNQKTKDTKGPFCSRKCAGIASHEISKYGQTKIKAKLVTNKSLMEETS